MLTFAILNSTPAARIEMEFPVRGGKRGDPDALVVVGDITVRGNADRVAEWFQDIATRLETGIAGWRDA